MSDPEALGAHRLFDATAVPAPEGQAEFPRQLVAQLDQFVRLINSLRRQVGALDGEAAPVGYFPRKKVAEPVAEPYAITWAEVGYAYDDVGAEEATGLLLPDPATYPEDNNERVPYFVARRGTANALRVTAQGDATIRIDAQESAANGNVELTTVGTLLIGLVDAGWVVYWVTGAWEVDAS